MKKGIFIIIGLFLILVIFILIFYTSNKSPIKIGLMVTLTGSSPELGREVRDGVFFAAEEINRKGGIKGRKIELLIKDNKGDVEVAKSNYLEFVNSNVIAVIGPVTSTKAQAILPLIDEYKLITISPTVSATEFSNREDYLIRLEPNNRQFTNTLAKYIKEKINAKRILIMIDERNPIYTKDFVGNFILNFDKNTFISTIPIKEDIEDYTLLVEKALREKPALVLVVTDVFRSSIIIQKIRKIQNNLNIVISPWARFHGLLSYTGHFSEGILSIGFYDESSKNENYIKFRELFEKKFGYIPDSAVINGYNAVIVIKEALERGADRNTIRDYVLNSSFKGPLGEFRINKYGDIEFETFMVVVKNGNFEKIEK